LLSQPQKANCETTIRQKETSKITIKPVYAAVMTTVSVQEFIPIHDKTIKTDRIVGKHSGIEAFVITEGIWTQRGL
jgi:hypothetical protein